MQARPRPGTPRSNWLTVAFILALITVPAALTLSRVRVPAVVDVSTPNPSPYGYTVSLLLFIVPIIAILVWLAPHDGVIISKKSVTRTIALLVPSGFALDFLFAHLFLTFPNPLATLGIPAPALGVPQGGAQHVFLGVSPTHHPRERSHRGVFLLSHRIHRCPASLYLVRRVGSLPTASRATLRNA